MAFARNFNSSEVFSIPTGEGFSRVKQLVTVILFCVKVPVLSEQIIFREPRVSTADSFLMMAFFFERVVTPIARTTATIAASPSGMAATARETDIRNISDKFLP